MNLQNFAYSGNPIIRTRTVSSQSAGKSYQVYNEGSLVAGLYAEPYNLRTRVDFAPICRSLFVDDESIIAENMIDGKVASRSYCSRNLCAEIAIEESGTNIGTYTILRGVLQKGESPIEGTFGIVALSDSFDPSGVPLINSYGDDYPAVFSLLYNNVKGIIYHRGKKLKISEDNFNSFVTTFELFDFGFRYTTSGSPVFTEDTMSTFPIYYNDMKNTAPTIIFRHCELPEHPFYIRWINNRGGWNTFMFSCNQTRTRTLESNLYLEIEGSMGEQQSYNKEGKEIVEASSGLVDMNTYEKLSWLQYSPVIQRYEPNKGWYNVQIDKCDATWKTNGSKKEMIISFVMPTLQINK